MIEGIEFGKWLSIKSVQSVIDKHLIAEDIHLIDGNRNANKDAHKFYEEILPIMSYAVSINANEVMFVDDTKNGNNFDGKIKLANNEIISIECTNAILPEDAIEQKILDRECKEKGFVEHHFESIEVSVFRKNLVNIIKQAIQNKINKSQKNFGMEKYKDFHLIVTLTASDFIWCSQVDITQVLESLTKSMEISVFAKVIFYNKCETGFPKYWGEI